MKECSIQSFKPVADETLSSWLYRLSYAHEINGKAVCKEAYLYLHSIGHFSDYDYSLEKGQCSELADAVGVPRYFLENYSREIFWHPIKNRMYFCPTCLDFDVANGGLPAWRRSWDLFESVVCPVHKSKLVYLRTKNNLFAGKAWAAFVQHSSDCESKAKVCHKFDGAVESGWKYIWWLAAKMQIALTSWIVNNLELTQGPFKGLCWWQLKYLFEDVISVLLRSHYRGIEERCLVSRWLNDPACYHQGIAYNGSMSCITREWVNVSDIRMRMITLIILGCLFGCYSDRELGLLSKRLKQVGVNQFFCDLKLREQMVGSSINPYELYLENMSLRWDPRARDIWREEMK